MKTIITLIFVILIAQTAQSQAQFSRFNFRMKFGFGVGEQSGQVSVQDPLPGEIRITSPEYGRHLNMNNQAFEFNPDDYAIDYQIQISESSDFAVIIDSVTTTSLSCVSPLIFLDNPYYVRIRGRNNTGEGPWQSEVHFWVNQEI